MEGRVVRVSIVGLPPAQVLLNGHPLLPNSGRLLVPIFSFLLEYNTPPNTTPQFLL